MSYFVGYEEVVKNEYPQFFFSSKMKITMNQDEKETLNGKACMIAKRKPRYLIMLKVYQAHS